MEEQKVTFKKSMTRGDLCSSYVHEIRWLGEIISHELKKKKVLVEEAKNTKHHGRQMAIQKKIRRCKTIVTGCSEHIKEYRSEMKQLQKEDPNNIKKKTSTIED